jgi:hypothetical protein
MTDEQWSTLTAWLKVPAAARAPIENELDLYRRFADAVASPPSETKKKLERAAALASELLGTIEDFGPEEHNALCTIRPITVTLPEDVEVTEQVATELAPLIGRPGTISRLNAFKLLAEQHAQVTALRDSMTTAAARLGRGKTGSDATNVRALVRRVSEIVETHIGMPLGKGKREFNFALQLCKLADPHISVGSTKGAIESLASKN